MGAAASLGKVLGFAGVLLAALAGAAEAPRRVVVLAPSAAEIVGELALADRLVGTCEQCDHPAAAMAGVPVVGSYVTPSVEAVVARDPDLVVAVPSPGNREAVAQIARLGIDVLVVHDRSLDDLWNAIDAIAGRFNVPERGAAVVARIRRELDAVRASVAERPRPTVLLVVGHRPLVVAGGGTLQDELIEIAGGRNLGRDLGGTWPTMSLEVMARRLPAVLIDAAMGSEAGMRALLPTHQGGGRPPRIVRVPIDALVRAGPRVAEAARLLARQLHPESDR